jgi:signal transduction histidine kinase
MCAKVSRKGKRFEGGSKYKLFFWFSPVPMIILGNESVVIDCNPEFARTMGMDIDNLRGAKLLKMVEVEHEQAVVLNEPSLCPETGSFQTTNPTTGKQYNFQFIQTFTENGMVLICIGESVFEMEPSGKPLSQKEKMAMIGQFAAGIAYELNTPLANINLIAENVKEELNNKDLQMELEKIQKQVEFSAKIVRDLLIFSRKDRAAFERLDMNELIRSTLKIMKSHLWVKDINLYLSEDDIIISGDPYQMQEVLINLLMNAHGAVEGGGEISIITRMSHDLVEVIIKDTGAGIPKEYIPKIFDPFFTTKPHGHGTGLGLAICKNIIDIHRGIIKVQSKPGFGTSFILQFRPFTSNRKGS